MWNEGVICAVLRIYEMGLTAIGSCMLARRLVSDDTNDDVLEGLNYVDYVSIYTIL